MDTGHGMARFAVWPCLDPGFPHDSSIALFAMVMYILFLCMMEVGNVPGARVKRLLQS